MKRIEIVASGDEKGKINRCMHVKWTIYRSVVVPFVLVISSCTGETERRQLDAAIEKEELRKLSVEKDIGKLKGKVDDLADRYEKAAEIENGVTEAIEARRLAQIEVEKLEKSVRDNASILSAYQTGYREPQNVLPAGLVLGNLTLKGGQQLQGAVVTQSNSVQVGIRHSAGIGVYPVEQLPDEITKNVPKRPTFAVGAVDINPLEVLRKRPDLLKTHEQKQADRADELERKYAVRDADLAAERAKRDEESKRRDAQRTAQMERQRQEEMAAQQTRQKLEAEVNAIASQIETLKNGINFQQSKKAELANQWANSSIRPAPAQQQKELSVFDARISEMGRSISQLETKMRELASRIEGYR